MADLASGSFVDQLLADLAGVRATEFPSVGPADLPRIGLSPPATEVVLQKGADVVARLAFGAAKADVTGRLYASRDGVVMLVDDRAQESLGKELSAFREGRLLPVDVWLVTRVVVEAGPLRAGAEKVEGAWRSAGREVDRKLAEDLVDRLSRTEVRRFVPSKDLGTIGLAPSRRTKPVPVGSVEVLLEKAKEPLRVEFFTPAELSSEGSLAVRVTGRGDTIVVDASVWTEVLAAAERVNAAAAAAEPTAPRGRKPASTPLAGPGEGAAP